MWSPASTSTRSPGAWRMASMFERTASAVPRYHSVGRPREMYGWSMGIPPGLGWRSQGRPRPMWSFSERGLYWVRTTTLSMPELTQLLRTKSMMRYLPPKGTAGFARMLERMESRSPSPPARLEVRVPGHQARGVGDDDDPGAIARPVPGVVADEHDDAVAGGADGRPGVVDDVDAPVEVAAVAQRG